MKKTTCVVFLIFAAALFVQKTCAADAVMQQAQGVFKPIPKSPPKNEKNPLTPEKIALGKMLYFEPRISKSMLIRCNTCHNIGLGGADFQETSIGHKWQKAAEIRPRFLMPFLI